MKPVASSIVLTILGLGLLFRIPAAAREADCVAARAMTEPGVDQSISLKAISSELQTCQTRGNCPTDILTMYGVTQITGYVIDANAHDVIVIGTSDKGAPTLYTEDFVTALKNALRLYARREGNILYYSNPGVSIDPDPNVLTQLDQFADRAQRSTTKEARDNAIDAWCKECELPQNVRVMGIPFDSHFAKVMVEADYLMKRIADGTAPVDGFEGLSDLSLRQAIEAIQQNSGGAVSIASMNRFWFYPGRHIYSEDAITVVIRLSDVILLDEAQHITQEGQVAASGRIDPLARKFACDFSRNYPAVAAVPRYHIYAELEGLFRWIALAKLMVSNNAFDAAGFTPTWLLDGFRMSNVSVPRKLVGIATVKKWDHVESDGSLRREINLRLPSCGGVEISLDKAKMQAVGDTSGLLLRVSQAVIKSRPNLEVTHWQVTMR
jgi:hypothetical protein